MGAGFNDRLVTDAGAMVAMPFVAGMGTLRLYEAITGTWTADATYLYGLFDSRIYNSSGAVNDSVRIVFQGTKVVLMASKNTASGIISVYIDDVLRASGIDLYTNVGPYSMQRVFALENLPPGQHVLKVVVTGKNPSSSGYGAYLEGLLVEAAANPAWIPGKTFVTGTIDIGTAPTITVSRATLTNGVGFWNNVAVSAGGTSTAVNTQGSRLRLLVNSSAATEITVQHSVNNSTWYDGEVISFTSAGTKTLVVDCCYYVRLKSSQAATITAGYIYLRG